MINFTKKKRESFRLDITPLINIVFLLLIFFMLTSSAVNQGLDVELPDAATAEKINSQEIALSIGENGDLLLENEKVSMEELSGKIKSLLDENGRDALIIQGDQNIEFGLFGEVLDRAREGGVVKFLIATDQLESEGEAT
ncbi:MAG: biopolymer transporter ExbD [Candidatus Nitronauta litoralis]|uniref:Biopolymer transporter ExbD n=1 Tax=Candidatus Nitronauta litoralis TaxID=2705533 RepID=A0A7T0G0R0_9BACT|nr:MAG: biopolymer transporter ExbD [Candidatus Nitronauta litoralis]